MEYVRGTYDEKDQTLWNNEDYADMASHDAHMNPRFPRTPARDEDYAWYIAEWQADFQAHLDARGGVVDIVCHRKK